MTSALVAEGLSWPTTLELFVPHAWIDLPSRREGAGIPPTARYQEKWRIAVRHIRQVRAAGVVIDAVVGDAEYGKVPMFRRALEGMGLRYALGVPACFPVWTPGARRSRLTGAVAARVPARRWRRVCWGEGTKGPLAARFVALRVRPTKSRRDCWLLCERTLTGHEDRKYYFIHAPGTWALTRLVALAHARWKIEQHYQELKGELGLDHFEGRSWRGYTITRCSPR